MHANSQYTAVNHPTLGMRLIPKPGSAIDRAVNRHLRFHDRNPGEPQNNLGLPGYRTPATAPEGSDYRDQEEHADLDPDLQRMAQQSDNPDWERLHAEQESRNRRRQPTNGTNGGDQVSAASAVNAATRGVHRLSELGEEVNRDQDPDEGEEDPDSEMVQERLVGQLPEPDEGFTYVLEREPTGEINVVMVPDTDGSDLHTNDRAYCSHTTGRDNVLARMNQIARNRYLTRDAATIRRTIFRHVPLRPSERLVLQSNDAYPGSVDVVLISPATEDMFLPQGGAKRFREDNESDEDPAAAYVSGAAPQVAGEYELDRPNFRDRAFRDHAQRNLLKMMNQSNRLHWARR